MTVYVIAHIDITNEAVYADYVAGFAEVFERYDGQFLAVDDDPLMLEGARVVTADTARTRTVLIRFPDRASALAWYRSDAYQELAAIRWRSSSGVVSLIEGDPIEDVK